jgi:hypothetical protein
MDGRRSCVRICRRTVCPKPSRRRARSSDEKRSWRRFECHLRGAAGHHYQGDVGIRPHRPRKASDASVATAAVVHDLRLTVATHAQDLARGFMITVPARQRLIVGTIDTMLEGANKHEPRRGHMAENNQVQALNGTGQIRLPTTSPAALPVIDILIRRRQWGKASPKLNSLHLMPLHTCLKRPCPCSSLDSSLCSRFRHLHRRLSNLVHSQVAYLLLHRHILAGRSHRLRPLCRPW